MVVILVTGGAGFIGSHLCEQLLLSKHTVICVDSFTDYYSPSFKEQNISHCLQNPYFTLCRTDINNFQALRNVFVENKIDVICHLAACVGVQYSFQNPLLYNETNCKGLLHVLELAKEFKVQKIIFASSSSVYGDVETIPFTEDSLGNPQSIYAVTKLTGEKLCFVYSTVYNIPCFCLRFFTVYGPRGRPDMSPYKFLESILHNKEIVLFGDSIERDYTYVGDIVTGIIHAVETPLQGYEEINLGNSHPVTLKYFLEVLEKVLGKKAQIRYASNQIGDMKRTDANITKAKTILKFQPKIGLQEGLTHFAQWYIKERKDHGKN